MMFALIITGLILKKVGVVGKEAQKGMTNLVIDLILPCNIIYSFMIKFSSKIAQDFVVILVISILIQVFCVILGGVLYNKCSVKRKKCLRYATICSNAGFLGNPIAQGVFGMMGLISIYLPYSTANYDVVRGRFRIHRSTNQKGNAQENLYPSMYHCL